MQLLKETVEFPNLFSGDIVINRVAFSLFGIDIYWYGILIAAGVILAFAYSLKQAKKVGLIADQVFDTAFISIIVGFIGARAYYCLFYNLMNPDAEVKYNLITMFTKIHDGGLAIYGGIIVGVICGVICCKVKKMPLLPLLDLAGPAFLIGQAIGRWGNFVNQECYGAPTAGNLPWGMIGSKIALDPIVIQANGQSVLDETILVHPCFLYESLWCVAGFLLISFLINKIKSFDGEAFLFYVFWYGAGRAWIEALRTDSLYAGSLKVSQVIAITTSVLALIMLIYFKVSAKKSGKALYADSEISKERLENYKKQLILDKEKEAAKKAMKQAEKAAKEAETAVAPSILGDSDDRTIPLSAEKETAREGEEDNNPEK